MSELQTEERVRADAPRPSGFYGITVPSSDLRQSKRFLVDVLCGKLLEENAKRVRVDFTNFIITAEPQQGGVIKPYLEQPHIAFDVTPEAYAGLRDRLHAHGVPTTKAWGRMGKPYALTYFRDPTGNQYEFFSPEGTTLEKVYGGRRGGNYVIDFPALAYDGLKEPVSGGMGLPFTPPSGFNHNTSAVRDLHEAKRFVTLIDALYEHKVNLICSAEVPPEALYNEGDFAFEFQRTVSRLVEMRSDAYLTAPHLT